ncbi:MAG: aldo/keto reductase [Caldilineaceae bacterium]
MPHLWAMPVVQTLADLQQAGKIRWYGISTNNWEAIQKLRTFGPIHVLQIGYNLLERSADEPALVPSREHWHADPGAAGQRHVDGQIFGRQRGHAGKGRHPLRTFPASGNRGWLAKAVAALLPGQRPAQRDPGRAAFVLDHPGVSCVIAGAKTRQQATENIAASDLPPLSAEELAQALPIADTIQTPGWI